VPAFQVGPNFRLKIITPPRLGQHFAALANAIRTGVRRNMPSVRKKQHNICEKNLNFSRPGWAHWLDWARLLTALGRPVKQLEQNSAILSARDRELLIRINARFGKKCNLP